MTGIASYLLPLSVFHAAGPGALDKVFGPDGDFEGAPFWVGPVTEIGRYCNHGTHRWVATIGRQIHTIEITPPLNFDEVAFDFRIPSVAARLSGLCARALGQTQSVGWWIGDANPEWCLQSAWGTRAFNWRLNGAPYGTGLPALPKGLLTREAFLAALTLTLAPKIAALP